MPDLVRQIAQNTVTHVLFAFVVMGGWAFFANSDHLMPKPLVAALVQGSISGGITLVMKRALERLSRRIDGTAFLFLPPFAVCSVSLMVLITLHSLAGTPAPLTTIALPFAVATTYAIFYNLTLWRGKENHD